AMLRFFSKGRHRPDPAGTVYAAVVDAARNPVFYKHLGVPDTLDGRFEILSILLHAVSRRLVHGRDPDPAFSRRVAEHFVVDMDSNLREMGVSDVRVGKKMKTLYGAYGGRIAAYDIALAAGGDALEEAVARNVFPQGAPDGAATALADYIRAAGKMLEGILTADICAGDVAFPDPAAVTPEVDTTTSRAS
ncbi:MAG TPA: ubiquinol-cytochrome C chaperone family protein, partial [Afifellaceae bacterium]|nr:ubiquinol-cytochrome C chaperone family protein [Afifellaceae bacterium]